MKAEERDRLLEAVLTQPWDGREAADLIREWPVEDDAPAGTRCETCGSLLSPREAIYPFGNPNEAVLPGARQFYPGPIVDAGQ